MVHFPTVMVISALLSFTLVGCEPVTSGGISSHPSHQTQKIEEPSIAGLGDWGPVGRETFTTQEASPYVVFNSITDNPAYGDERDFFQLKRVGENNNTYTNILEAQTRERYKAYIYFQNSASPLLDEPAKNTRLKVLAPSTITGAGEINAIISADNASPKQIWDSSVIKLPEKDYGVYFQYISDSATIHSSGNVNGKKLSEDELFGEGVLLGVDELNGTINGDTKSAGYVTFEFTLGKPNFTVTTLARSDPKSEFRVGVNSKVGRKVEIKAQYKNTGAVAQNNVHLKMKNLSEGIELVEDSVQLAASTTGGYVGIDVKENQLADSGFNIGSYAPGGDAYVKFTLRITGVDGHNFHEDGQIFYYPEMIAYTDNGTKSSGAKVLVFGKNQ